MRTRTARGTWAAGYVGNRRMGGWIIEADVAGGAPVDLFKLHTALTANSRTTAWAV